LSKRTTLGGNDGLEPRGRKLETNKREDQREVGPTHRDDLTQIDGRRDQLEGKIQERYGLAKDRARKDVEDWLSKMN
jgi:uncharacterized protein YjbJ (UPF0337 family)